MCDFKTTIDPSITSLHYLTANMLHTAPELDLPSLFRDMPTVQDAAKVSSEALNMNMDALLKGLDLLRNEFTVAKHRSIVDGDQSLTERMSQLSKFESSVSTIVISLQDEFEQTSEAVYETSRFFGDESAHQASMKNS